MFIYFKSKRAMPHMQNNNALLKTEIDTFNNRMFNLLVLIYQVRNISYCSFT